MPTADVQSKITKAAEILECVSTPLLCKQHQGELSWVHPTKAGQRDL